MADPIKRIKRRFELNMGRVANLVAVHDVAFKNQKVSPSRKQDLLRASVVFLHATLEDLLREAIRWKAPVDNKKFVAKLLLESDRQGTIGQDKFAIEDLLEHKGKTVDDIIDISIQSHLDKRSFNHIEDVVSAIKLIGVNEADYRKYFSDIGASIARRHKIVHQSDRTPHNERSHGPPTVIDVDTVAAWAKATNSFGKLLLRNLAGKG